MPRKNLISPKNEVAEHEQKEVLHVDVMTPAHPARGAESELFRKTKRILEYAKIPPLIVPRSFGRRCYICGKTEDELGEPLEAHHFHIEWSMGEAEIDWRRVEEDHPRYSWDLFDVSKPMEFVDDMAEQGLLLCKKHHTGKDTGIHELPFSIWIMQRYLKHGVEFAPGIMIDKGKEWQ